MKNQVLLLTALLITLISQAQAVNHLTASPYLHQEAYSNSNTTAFSFTSNAAALAKEKELSFGIYGEKRFFLQELSSFGAAFVLPASSGNFGFQTFYFGNPFYNELSLGLAYGKKLGEKVDVGVQFDVLNNKANGYESQTTVNAAAGVIFHFTPQFNGGLHINNPAQMNIGKGLSQKWPATFSAAFGYNASEKLFIGTELVKTEGDPVNVNAGLNYQVDEKLFVKGGMSAANSMYYFGIGALLQHFRLDVVATVHPYLGLSPGLMLNYKPSYEQK